MHRCIAPLLIFILFFGAVIAKVSNGCADKVAGWSEPENELKYLLDEENYQKLIKALSNRPPTAKTLTNVYLDILDKFPVDKSGKRARLRFEEGESEVVLTVKVSETKMTGRELDDAHLPLASARDDDEKVKIKLKLKKEISQHLTFEQANGFRSGAIPITEFPGMAVEELAKIFEGHPEAIASLRDIGSIETLRLEYQVGNLKFEVDRSLIFGKYYYELEIEIPDSHDVVLVDEATKAMLEGHDIKFEPSTKSKSSRFYKALRKSLGLKKNKKRKKK